ncbi:MAG: flagellar protein FlbB [Pseudolabrys sp.]|jgi:flagellar motility protein MotE (MotC chaperone)
MIRFPRTTRLLPVVIVAAVCLLALKVSGLVFDGGYTLGERLAERGKPQLTITSAASVPAHPKIVYANGKAPPQPGVAASDSRLSWAQQMFNYGGANPDITGSVSESDKKNKDAGPDLKVSKKAPVPTKVEQGADAVVIGAGRIASPGERAILERLRERSKELDQRSRDLDMRESLLKAAEKRVEAKVQELKDLEENVKTATGMRKKVQKQNFKGLVEMYTAMNPKDAARIFDKLDIDVQVEVASAIKPRVMSAIMAKMTATAAQRLTVELANRASASDVRKPASTDKLPKIGSDAGES